MSHQAAPEPPNSSRLIVAATFACLFSASVALGIVSPLIGVLMNEAGLSRTAIGLNVAMFALAALLITPFTPRLLRALGAARFLTLCLTLCALTSLAFKLVSPGLVWFPIRLVMGAGLAGLWVCFETSINHYAAEHHRGLLIGLYSTIHTGGYALGAGLIGPLGAETSVPFVIAAALMALAALPLWTIGALPAGADETDHIRIAPYLRAVPIIMAGAFAFGIAELGVVVMLPVYAVRAGLSPQQGTTLLFAATILNAVLQIPLGLISDRTNRRLVLLALTGLALASALALPFTVHSDVGRIASVVLLGPATFGFYSVSLSLLGQRYKGPQLSAANSAFVFAYGAGSLIGPPLSGLAMDLWDPHGLMAFTALIALGYAALLAFGRRGA